MSRILTTTASELYQLLPRNALELETPVTYKKFNNNIALSASPVVHGLLTDADTLEDTPATASISWTPEELLGVTYSLESGRDGYPAGLHIRDTIVPTKDGSDITCIQMRRNVSSNRSENLLRIGRHEGADFIESPLDISGDLLDELQINLDLAAYDTVCRLGFYGLFRNATIFTQNPQQ